MGKPPSVLARGPEFGCPANIKKQSKPNQQHLGTATCIFDPKLCGELKEDRDSWILGVGPAASVGESESPRFQ